MNKYYRKTKGYISDGIKLMEAWVATKQCMKLLGEHWIGIPFPARQQDRIWSTGRELDGIANVRIEDALYELGGDIWTQFHSATYEQDPLAAVEAVISLWRSTRQ